MSRRTCWFSVIIALLFVLTACSSSSGAGTRGSEVVTIHLADEGRSITLHVGDRLNLDLVSSSKRHWVIARFPHDVLSDEQDLSGGGFMLTASAPGRGQVAIVDTFACPGATLHGCSVPEPGNMSPTSPTPAIFTLVVRVEKPGPPV